MEEDDNTNEKDEYVESMRIPQDQEELEYFSIAMEGSLNEFY